jgi:hypothetical protein
MKKLVMIIIPLWSRLLLIDLLRYYQAFLAIALSES